MLSKASATDRVATWGKDFGGLVIDPATRPVTMTAQLDSPGLACATLAAGARRLAIGEPPKVVMKAPPLIDTTPLAPIVEATKPAELKQTYGFAQLFAATTQTLDRLALGHTGVPMSVKYRPDER